MEYLILFLPLLASIISGFFGKLIGDKMSQIITSLFVSISALLSLAVFYKVATFGYENNLIIVNVNYNTLINFNLPKKTKIINTGNNVYGAAINLALEKRKTKCAFISK